MLEKSETLPLALFRPGLLLLLSLLLVVVVVVAVIFIYLFNFLAGLQPEGGL